MEKIQFNNQFYIIIFISLIWEDWHSRTNLYFQPFLKLQFNVNIVLKNYTILNPVWLCQRDQQQKRRVFLKSASLEAVYKECTVEVASGPTLDILFMPEGCGLWENRTWTLDFAFSPLFLESGCGLDRGCTV